MKDWLLLAGIIFFCLIMLALCTGGKESDLAYECYKEWKNRVETGSDGELLSDSIAITGMVMDICSTKANFYAKGYRVNPYVNQDDFSLYIKSGVDEHKYGRNLLKRIRSESPSK